MVVADTGERIGAAIAAGWPVVLIFSALTASISFAVAWAILKSAERPAPTLLVMSLSMLTLLSIVAFVVSGSQEMGTLAGVGLGALAAAVSTMFGRIAQNPTHPPDPAVFPHLPPHPDEENPYVDESYPPHEDKTDGGM